MASTAGVKHRSESCSFFNIVPPQDGGYSLLPMESLLRGVRNEHDVLSLEIFGRDGVVGYCARTNNGNGFSGMFHSHFPQAQLTRSDTVQGRSLNEGDWMYLDEDEFAFVQTLSLERESYLPLRIFDARSLGEGELDPLAGIVGILSNDSKTVGYGEGGDRIGLRVIIRPAPEEWGLGWQKHMQRRRDGEDRSGRGPGMPSDGGGPSIGMVLGLTGLVGVMAGNYMLWEEGNYAAMAALDAAAVVGGGLLLAVVKKFFGNGSKRRYMDELLVENKLKSLGFYCEVQLVRIYRRMEDEDVARSSLDELSNCLRSFDDPAGNCWSQGRVRQYSGQRVFQGAQQHPFHGGTQEWDFLDGSAAKDSVLSVSEVSSLWHLPLGSMDMASMERNSAGFLPAYLGDLRDAGEDFGPLIGVDGDGNGLRLPESAVRKHAIVIGKSGVGKSTLVKHVVAHKLKRKAEGKDDDAIVVVDPHADLVRDLLQMVPLSIANKVRLLDFGRDDRVPGLNLVDPHLFPDRDRCVDTIVTTLKGLWEAWGNRLEDLLKNSLLIVYEFNQHPDTDRSEMLTMLDILHLLEDGVVTGQGRDKKTEMSSRQREIMSRVRDPRLRQWFDAYLGWPPDQRAEAVGPVRSRIGAYASHKRASVVMGQRESTIVLSDVLSEGLVLLVSTSQGTVGKQPAALLGGTMVSLVESELREQEKLATRDRKRCLLICDEFQTITGADWESLFAEIRKYGCAMMLATQSMARLNSPDRRLKEGVLGNVGVIVAYQMSSDDARIISPEMDSTRVEERFLVNSYPHHCYIRINSDTKCYQAFSMKTLPPPEDAGGSEEAQAEVIRASVSYTVDLNEARERMNGEIATRLRDGVKLGSDMDNPAASVYDRAVSRGPRRRKGGSRDGDGDGDGNGDGGSGGGHGLPPEGGSPALSGNLHVNGHGNGNGHGDDGDLDDFLDDSTPAIVVVDGRGAPGGDSESSAESPALSGEDVPGAPESAEVVVEGSEPEGELVLAGAPVGGPVCVGPVCVGPAGDAVSAGVSALPSSPASALASAPSSSPVAAPAVAVSVNSNVSGSTWDSGLGKKRGAGRGSGRSSLSSEPGGSGGGNPGAGSGSSPGEEAVSVNGSGDVYSAGAETGVNGAGPHPEPAVSESADGEPGGSEFADGVPGDGEPGVAGATVADVPADGPDCSGPPAGSPVVSGALPGGGSAPPESAPSVSGRVEDNTPAAESAAAKPVRSEVPLGELADRILRGPLKGLSLEEVDKSKVSLGAMEFLAGLSENDPVFRALQDKRLGDLIGKTKRDVRREETETIREELRSEYEAMLAEAVRRAREEERVSVMSELAEEVLESPGGEVEGRDRSKLKRSFIQG